MPVYFRLLQTGTPAHGRVPAHTPEWTNLGAASPRQASGAIPEVDDQVLVTFESGDSASTSFGTWVNAQGLDVNWDVAPYAPKGSGPATLTAQIEFTRPLPGGKEIADLRVQLHDVRVVHSEHVSRAGSVVTRMAIACGRMTLAGARKSAPDVSQQVRARIAGESAQARRAR